MQQEEGKRLSCRNDLGREKVMRIEDSACFLRYVSLKFSSLSDLMPTGEQFNCAKIFDGYAV